MRSAPRHSGFLAGGVTGTAPDRHGRRPGVLLLEVGLLRQDEALSAWPPLVALSRGVTGSWASDRHRGDRVRKQLEVAGKLFTAGEPDEGEEPDNPVLAALKGSR